MESIFILKVKIEIESECLLKKQLTKEFHLKTNLKYTAKNNIKYVECICQVEFTDGKPFKLLGTFQDITKEQNLINELQLNVEKFSSIFSSANDAIFIIDTSNGIITRLQSEILRTYRIYKFLN